MFEVFWLICFLIYIFFSFKTCQEVSCERKINLYVAIFLFITLTPLIGYVIACQFKLRNSRGCKWCGNKDNETEFCGLCLKNEIGKFREIIIKKN